MASTKSGLKDLSYTAWRCFRSAFIFAPGLFSGITVIGFFQSLIGYVQLGTMGFIIDELVVILRTHSDPTKLYYYIGIYTAALVVPSIITKIYYLLDTQFYRRFTDYNSLTFLRSVATRDIQIIESGEYQNKRSKAREQGVWNIYSSSENTGLLFAKTLSILVALGYLSSLNWRFAVLGAVAAIPSLLVEYFHGERVYGSWSEDTKERRIFEENKDHIHQKQSLIEVKLFQNIQWFLDAIWSYMYSFQKIMLSKERERMKDELVGVLVNSAAFTAALYLITNDVLAGGLTIGGVTVVLGAYSKLEGDLSELFRLSGAISKSSRYAQDFYDVLDTKNVLVQPEHPHSIDSAAPEIEFRNVWFRYPNSDTWIFQNLNLTITGGTRIALVGHNGAGKTTFVHLLLRIYDPTRGQVLINGVDLREIDIDEYYQNTAALMQEFAVFKFKVNEAIALGDTSMPYDHDRMLAAAHASHSYSFIERWEEGYNSMIGREFDGKELSGGERQRMAIARVFYRDAGLVILDEPTSAVDAIAEQEIFESVYNTESQKTILTISHRFSTVKKSDVIVVLEHGHVVEQGSHTDLIASKGRYWELYSAQASAYTD